MDLKKETISTPKEFIPDNQDNTVSNTIISNEEVVIFNDHIEEKKSKVNFKAVKNTATIEDEFIKQKKQTFSDPKGNKVESINYSNMMENLDQRDERKLKEELIEK
jgi:hypothetical protein